MRKIKLVASTFYMKQAVRISAKNEGVRTWTAVERVGKYFEWSISEKNMEKKKKSTECPNENNKLKWIWPKYFFSRNMLPRSTGCKNNGQITQKLSIIFKKSAEGQGFSGGSVVENPPTNPGDMGSIPGPRRSHMPRSN